MNDPKKPGDDRSWADDVTNTAPEAGFSINVGEARDDRELPEHERYDADEDMADDATTEQYSEQTEYDWPGHPLPKDHPDHPINKVARQPRPAGADKDGNLGDPYGVKSKPRPDKNGSYQP